MTRRQTMQPILEPTQDVAWILDSEGYDPIRESSIESRFVVSNGFLGIRGGRATSRSAGWTVPARTYVAGLFDTPETDETVPGLVPAADWLQLRILLSGTPMVHHPGDVLSDRTTLDMRRGALLSEGRHSKLPDLIVRVRTMRLVSLSERSVGLQVIEFEIEAGTTEITLEASFQEAKPGLVPEQIEQNLGLWRTRYSDKRLAMATESSLRIDGRGVPPASLGPLKASWTWQTQPGQVVSFERVVAIVRSDGERLNPGVQAREKLALARQMGWRSIVAAHEAAWLSRWECSDVEVGGDPAAQIALRFAIYHLNSAANPSDERVSIGARALSGDGYRGHVFWDTEIFLLPFYVLTWPEAARALLKYRFHTLDAARAKAAGMGWRGALYAWESADTGAETTPDQVIGPDQQVIDVLCGRQEQHISADIAYAVWQYWQATGDETFLHDAGAEIILETGRFWSSRAQLGIDGEHHIRGVIGPDEYHEHIDDNAYTNVMACWNIRRALDVAALLRERAPDVWAGLSNRLGLDEAELRHWRDVAETMAIGRDPDAGIFEQFTGYFGLEDIDLTNYAGRTVPIDVVLGRERTQKTQVIKQADVVALLALLPEEFTAEEAVANFRYYEPRCSHGSSLSPAMHGLVAAREGDVEMALRYFRQTAAIDLTDTHVASDGGVHIAALGGMWMLAVFGFGGVSLRDNAIAIDPQLPAAWRSLVFKIQWRHRHLRIRIDQDKQVVEATLEAGEPMTLVVGGEAHQVHQQAVLRIAIGQPCGPRTRTTKSAATSAPSS
jgi:trehalose/maltose hydrolase-like predicted phosphorylase